MRQLKFICLGALVALAACSDKAPAVNEAQAEAAVANIEQSPGANVAAGLPVADEKAQLVPTAVPPAFDGRWGQKPSDCDIARGDTPGLLVIKDSALKFYDASATAKVVGGPTRYKVIADLSYSDRGRKWQRRETFELTNAGTILLRSEPGAPKPYRYERC